MYVCTLYVYVCIIRYALSLYVCVCVYACMHIFMSHDDGCITKHYDKADIILLGISRSGKTPTCLYMALQYGIYAANFPLTEEDLENSMIPEV